MTDRRETDRRQDERRGTYCPSIAERIAWTSGQLSSSEGKVLVALWSCGDYETGRNCYPKWHTLIGRSGLSRATVARTLVRLDAGGWIVATCRRHRHPTNYDICLDRLATRPPKEQQVTLTTLLDAPDFESQVESQIETQASVESQSETQLITFESQFETPTSDPDLVPNVHTHTPRARETYDADPDLPLVGAVPLKRCDHPHAHAWCEGRIHVPRKLHFELLERLGFLDGESRAEKAGRLIAFYAADQAQLPSTVNVGNPFKYWNEAFEEWIADPRRWDLRRPQPTRAEPPLDEEWHCPHPEPKHTSAADCLREMALYRKLG
jgi:hypothetical protein